MAVDEEEVELGGEPDPQYVDPSPDQAPAPDLPQDDRDVKDDPTPED